MTGEVSVSPYPSTSRPPESFSNFSATATGSGAAPEKHCFMDERSYFCVSGDSLMAMKMRGTPGNIVGFSVWTAFSAMSSSKRGRRISFSALLMATPMIALSP